MRKERGKGIQRAEGAVYKGASVSSSGYRQKMRMEVDALDYAMGGVLLMECEDGLWRPVAFLYKSLNETERNYKIHDKEMLVIVRGLEVWRHLLEGAQTKFKIWTDHKNLEYFMKAQKLNRRQAR